MYFYRTHNIFLVHENKYNMYFFLYAYDYKEYLTQGEMSPPREVFSIHKSRDLNPDHMLKESKLIVTCTNHLLVMTCMIFLVL